MADIFGAAGNDTLLGTAGADLLNGFLGADLMLGGQGDDLYYIDNAGDVATEAVNAGLDSVAASISVTLGANIEGLLLRGAADIDGTGNALKNQMVGNIGANTLKGGDGDDLIFGNEGDDTLNGDAGTDVLVGGDGDDALNGGTGNDVMFGGSGTNVLTGGAGNDTYVIDDGFDSIVELAGEGIDTIQSDKNFNLSPFANIENLSLGGVAIIGRGNALDNVITGNDNVNALYGADGNDTLDGGLGKDVLVGGRGNDTYLVDDAQDLIYEAPGDGTDLVKASVTYDFSVNPGQEIENLTLTGKADIDGYGNDLANVITGNSGNNFLSGKNGNDTLIGGAGNDTLLSGAGDDAMIGGAGNDTYSLDSLGDKITELAGEGIDTVSVVGAVNYTLGANLEKLDLFLATGNASGTGNTLDNEISGSNEDNKLDGGAGNDKLLGGGGIDTLIGGLGNDRLDGEAGDDNLQGGAGNDTYVIGAGAGSDTIVELAGAGTDTVEAAKDYNLALFANLENLVLTGAAVIGQGNAFNNAITGTAGANELYGVDGNDTLDGGGGVDKLVGGKGNDTYVVDNKFDAITETAGEGTDLVQASVDYDLSNNIGQEIENLTLTGKADIDGLGNDINNVITGNGGFNYLFGGKGNDTLLGGDGDDTLEGGLGTDAMTGGKGDDTYVVDDLTDKVTEAAAEGTDTVYVLGTLNYTLGANVENLILSAATGNVNGTGNGLDNALFGNDNDNKLDGAAGNDFLDGGIGSDTLIGGTGNDWLDGGAGTNTLTGGAGNDTYDVGVGADTIVELAGQGIDTVQSSKDYNLALFANLENLTLTGAAVIGQGNAVDNVITGTGSANALYGLDGNDRLDGGAGIDTLVGGKGNDTYVVDDANDAITEAGGEGIDLVQASVNYDLANNAGQEIENLTLTGGGNIFGGGNDLANVITGNTGDNFLDGGKGNDTLVGGAGNDALDGGIGNDTLTGGKGNDVYYIDSLADKVIEAVNEGLDTVYVQGTLNYVLAANVEILDFFYASGNVNGTGNGLDNVIYGNGGANKLDGGAGNDRLDGGAGIDTLIGGAGNDTYVVSAGADSFIELAGQGIDTVESGVDFSLGAQANIENLILGGVAVNGLGNTLDNVITGNASANILDGGAGNDQLFGNGGADDLEGGDGADKLDGGTGADTLAGGKGNDIYLVDDANDKIFENAGEGIDLVLASNSYDLSSNVGQEIENLTLTGGNDFGYGNDLNNIITGNGLDNLLRGGKGNDTLLGGAGKDTLDGGAGNDILTGGKDDDTYYVDSLLDKVTEAANEGHDEVQVFGAISYVLGANLEDLNLINAVGDMSGTGNTLDNQILGNTGSNLLDGGAGNDHLDGRGGNDTLIGGLGDDRLDGGTGDDNLQGGAGNDLYVIDSAKDTLVELIGGGIDTVQSEVSFDLGFGFNGNVENLTLTGAAVFGTGNGLNNVIIGNAGGNLLNGGEGQDTLFGANGDDILGGGIGNDVIEGGLGKDTMKGEAGNDLFLYRLDNVGDLFNLGGDTINGFESGKDHIDVNDLFRDFNIDPLDNPYTEGYLKLSVSGSDTLVQFDQNGGGDGYITLATVTSAVVTQADLLY